MSLLHASGIAALGAGRKELGWGGMYGCVFKSAILTSFLLCFKREEERDVEKSVAYVFTKREHCL